MARKPGFTQIIREAGKKRGMTVADVAERVGVSAPCVYLWETDQTRARAANLSALCKALKLPIRATRELAAA